MILTNVYAIVKDKKETFYVKGFDLKNYTVQLQSVRESQKILSNKEKFLTDVSNVEVFFGDLDGKQLPMMHVAFGDDVYVIQRCIYEYVNYHGNSLTKDEKLRFLKLIAKFVNKL